MIQSLRRWHYWFWLIAALLLPLLLLLGLWARRGAPVMERLPISQPMGEQAR